MRATTQRTPALPTRRAKSRKGENGKVLVVGGSEEYAGAVILAGLAALRSGADLVHIAAPEKVAWAVNAHTPDLVTRKLPGRTLGERHFNAIEKMASAADVMLIGNGIGQSQGTKRLCKRLSRMHVPKVIDADALKAITLDDPRLAVLTPNRGEWRTLLRNSGMPYTENAEEIRSHLLAFFRRGNVLLLKGPSDTILSGRGAATISGGNPGMTKGGTGDVLAGLVAGLRAQGLDAHRAAARASTLNKRVGDMLYRRHKGYTYLASDMAEEIRRLRSRRLRRQ